ncbi:MAG: sulfite exporter TauE/SafE family protein [Planctomycetota bacterium]
MLSSRQRERIARYAPFGAWVLWFDCAWLAAVVHLDLWAAIAREWPIALAMALGSYVAGSTPMGGGTVGFPILVLLFDEPVGLGRNFSFLIQSVGMSSATLLILCSRKPLALRPLLWTLATATIVVPIANRLLVPVVTPAAVKLIFAVIWAGFGVMTLFKLRDLLRTHRTDMLSSRGDAIVGVCVGVVGGTAAALTGVGIDMVMYTVLVLLYRCDLRIAIATSVIAMAWTSIVGTINAAALGEIDAAVLSKWAAAAPVVLVGAPIGAFMLHVLPRGGTLVFVSVLCLAQFFWALERVGPGAVGIALSIGGVLLLNACFHLLYNWGGRRLSSAATGTG